MVILLQLTIADVSVGNPDAHVVSSAADGAGLLRAATVGAQLLRLIPPEKNIWRFSLWHIEFFFAMLLQLPRLEAVRLSVAELGL